MGDRSDNGCPPTPSGMGGVRRGTPEGHGSLMPLGSPQSTRRPSLSAPFGVVYCALGGVIASSSMPVVAPALLGYGLLSALSGDRLSWKVAAPVAALAVAVAFSAPYGVSAVTSALLTCLASFVVAGVCVRGRMTPGVGCVLAAGMTLAHLGAEAVLASLAGTSLPAVMQGVIETFLQGLELSSVDGVIQLQVLNTLLDVLWPMAYVLMGVSEVVLSVVGVWLAVSRQEEAKAKVPRLSEFDLPLWVVGILVAGIAVLAVQLTTPSLASSGIIMVSANVVLGLRFALALQGLGVLTWFAHTRISSMTRVLLYMLALYLEMQFFVLTAVGLVDVWVNFRHLQRGSDPDAPDSTKQDREPDITG